MRDDSATTFRTDDIDGAAYLIAEGGQLVSVERAAAGFSVFTIEGVSVRELAERYVRGNVVVNIDRFIAARRLLLDRIGRARRLAT